MEKDWNKRYTDSTEENYSSDNQRTPPLMLFDLQTEPERLDDEDAKSVIAPPMYRWTTETSHQAEPSESKENKEVLNPHHPLLARFQQTLKAHLTKQIEKLNVEMLELETSVKEEEKQKEALGVMVYDKQQDICRQQNILETVEKDLQDLVAKREKHEEDVINLRKAHQLEYQELLKAEEQERNLRNETESLTLLEKQLTKWKEEMNSELTINKRISDKSLKDKKQLAEEKRQLDMIIYNLMTDTWKCETEIEQLDVQLRVQEAKKEELSNALQDANSNLEALHSQQNTLLKAWNNVLFNLKQRDNQYQEAMETVKNLTGQLRVQISEIEVLKRNIEKEMKDNLQINERKLRIENDYTNTTKQIVAEEERLHTLSAELNNQRMIIKYTEADLHQVNAANQEREFELNKIVKDIEKQTRVKVDLEDKVMNHLDECDTNDKAAANLSKFVRQLKEKCRQLEIKMLSSENTDAKLLVEIEQLKGSNTANIEYINSLKKLHNERDDNVKKLNIELTALKNSTLMRKRKIDNLNNKLNDLIANAKGCELSPQEVQIRDTEKAIESTIAEVRALEINWIRDQNNVVNLTQQRNEQIYQINLLSKQILIIQQKNLQLEDELDKHKRRENEMTRNINRLLKRLEKLNLDISRNRSINEKEDCQISICQNKFLDQLQDLERECAQLETDIADLETEKQSLAKQLLEVNREGLMWQKQAQMATEARKAVEEDRTSGESSQMRIEIHRMQVRYNQLRRMQERMIVDLEQCVFRREDIIGKSEAKTKREKGGMSQTRLLFSRKINEMKSKIKQTKKELEQTETNISNCNEQNNMLKEQLENNYNELEKIKGIIPELSLKLEELDIKKHNKLDRLIKSQRKARYYDDIIKGNFKTRSNQILDIEIIKQQELQSNINEIVKQLLYDFPQHKAYLTKILITLGSYQDQ